MTKKRYSLGFYVIAEAEIDDEVIDRVDDEWRSQFYNLHTKEDILSMVVGNIIFRHCRIDSLDGWSDLPDNKVLCRLESWELEEFAEE